MSVTVVIPVYDAAGFVADTVRSALAQTHADLLVRIAVEPGGPGAPHEPAASLAALAEFRSDPRVRIDVNAQRFGWTGNITRMLAAVETPFFAILPHDDRWHPRYLETLLALLAADPAAGVAYCDIRQYGERRSWRARLPIRRDADRLGQIFDFFLEGPAGMPWRGVTRTATLALTGGFPDWEDLGMAAETEYALRLVAAARVLHHDAVLFAKRGHTGERQSASQERAAAAIADGRFENQITPVEVMVKREKVAFKTDEHPKATSAEALAGLRPAFQKDGTVTAGNASGINDGAAALVLARADKAEAAGLKPKARVLGYAHAGVRPEVMGVGPIPAVQALLERTGLSADDFDVIESNEAFAAQAIAVNRALGLDTGKVNPNGGAIALGHPVGVSGTRIVITLLHEMKRRNLSLGMATLCVGGGQGAAIIVERK